MPETSPKQQDAGNGKDPRYKGIDRVLKRQQYKQEALIEVLTSAQEAFGYLPEEVMIYIARQLKLPFSWVYGVATFYHFFSLKPQGECIRLNILKQNGVYNPRDSELLLDPHTFLLLKRPA